MHVFCLRDEVFTVNTRQKWKYAYVITWRWFVSDNLVGLNLDILILLIVFIYNYKYLK